MFNTEGHEYSISEIVGHECSTHLLNSRDMNNQSCGHECSMKNMNSWNMNATFGRSDFMGSECVGHEYLIHDLNLWDINKS